MLWRRLRLVLKTEENHTFSNIIGKPRGKLKKAKNHFLQLLVTFVQHSYCFLYCCSYLLYARLKIFTQNPTKHGFTYQRILCHLLFRFLNFLFPSIVRMSLNTADTTIKILLSDFLDLSCTNSSLIMVKIEFFPCLCTLIHMRDFNETVHMHALISC